MPRFHKSRGSLTEKVDQISVIVPVYNGEAYLEACIESIINQSYPDLEIIIVNDGSTDGTAQVCDRLQNAYGNLHMITLGDEGVSAARNAGIEAASGDFLMFVDADDRLRPGVLRGLHEILIGTDSDVAGCGFAAWGTEGEWDCLRKEGEMPGTLTGGQAVIIYDNTRYLKEGILCGNTRCWSKLYRRSLIGQVRFREGLSIGEDMLFLVELLPHIRRAAETPYPGYGYYQNPRGAMGRPFTPAYMDQIRCWEMARELMIKQDQSLSAQADAQIMVAVMLTVGKIAVLPAKKRREAKEYLRVCREKLRAITERRARYAYLPAGYGIKVRLFAACPRFYVWLYRLQKSGK